MGNKSVNGWVVLGWIGSTSQKLAEATQWTQADSMRARLQAAHPDMKLTIDDIHAWRRDTSNRPSQTSCANEALS